MRSDGKYFQADGVHPNVEGARIMAGMIAKDLKKSFNK
jgi:lysophospholipase L1-like esterase